MRLVMLVSRFPADAELGRLYLAECLVDSMARGEAPYASHTLLDDANAEGWDPARAAAASRAWACCAEAVVVYTDLGVSRAAERAMLRAQAAGKPVEMRQLIDWRPPARVVRWGKDGSDSYGYVMHPNDRRVR